MIPRIEKTPAMATYGIQISVSREWMLAESVCVTTRDIVVHGVSRKVQPITLSAVYFFREIIKGLE